MRRLLLSCLLILAVQVPALAQNAPPSSNESAPPAQKKEDPASGLENAGITKDDIKDIANGAMKEDREYLSKDLPKETLNGKPMPAFPKSLLFTDDESDRIAKFLAFLEGVKSAAARAPTVKPVPPEPRPNVYLSALVYSSDSDWAAWINGVRYRPGTVQNGIRPIQASPRWILLDVDTAQGPTVRVRLTPNQTYLSNSDKVVDGIYP